MLSERAGQIIPDGVDIRGEHSSIIADGAMQVRFLLRAFASGIRLPSPGFLGALGYS